jgi:hypothetical protein
MARSTFLRRLQHRSGCPRFADSCPPSEGSPLLRAHQAIDSPLAKRHVDPWYLVLVPIRPQMPELICSVCKKQKDELPWQCILCERAGVDVKVCSGVCKRRHERNGAHRKALKRQRIEALGPNLAKPKYRGNRVQVRIVRRTSTKESTGQRSNSSKKARP